MKKTKKGAGPARGVARSAEQFEEAAKRAIEDLARAGREAAAVERQARTPAAGSGPGSPPAGDRGGTAQTTASLASLEVAFNPAGAPPPAFAGVCVVHRFPEYVLIDFGSIDPLQVEVVPGGQKAQLQHVGRVCLPESTARRLLVDLANIYGSTAG